jgi:hypothetical protein
MKKYILALLLCVGLTPIYATEAFLLTDIGSSARMIGIGNIEGFSTNANTVFENPAGLHYINNYSLTAFTTKIIDEVTYRNIALGINTDYGHFGFGYMSADVTDIPYTSVNKNNNQFEADYFFKYENMLAKLAYEIPFTSSIHIGTSLNYYKNTFGNITEGDGFNMDFGLLWEANPGKVSLIGKNILQFSKANYDTGESETYPLQILVSGLYPISDFSVLAQLKLINNFDKPLKAFGLKYEPSWLPFIDFYGGYKEFRTLFLQKVEGHFTLGVSLSLFGVHFDYAYEKADHVDFNNSNYFSVSLDL